MQTIVDEIQGASKRLGLAPSELVLLAPADSDHAYRAALHRFVGTEIGDGGGRLFASLAYHRCRSGKAFCSLAYFPALGDRKQALTCPSAHAPLYAVVAAAARMRRAAAVFIHRGDL